MSIFMSISLLSLGFPCCVDRLFSVLSVGDPGVLFLKLTSCSHWGHRGGWYGVGALRVD